MKYWDKYRKDEIKMSEALKFRRDLHKIPELGMELPKTYAYIKNVLQTLPCEIFSPIPYSVCAFFDAGREKTVAFRSDMDALPVEEKTGRDFASEYSGRMHACGHDGHMAMLLTFALRLSEIYQTLPNNILLIFQPGEENPGGAGPLCETGFLEKYHVKRIYGCHLWPMLPKGAVASRKNEMMARSSEINIDITGKAAHAAKYKEGIDALEYGAQMLTDIYTMEKEEIGKDVYRLLRFGRMESGTIRNVVSSHTRIEGTMRAFQDEIYDYMKRRIHEIARGYDEKYGLKTEIDINTGYPAVMNDPQLYDETMAFLGQDSVTALETPEMITEDFAYYQKYVPGMFFFLGTGTGIALHADHFDFDEAVLDEGVGLYLKLCKMP